jgi:glutaredoxin-like protein
MVFGEGDRLALIRKFGTGMKDEISLLVFVDETVAASSDLVAVANSLAQFSPKIKVQIEKVVNGKNPRMSDLRIENYPVLVLSKGDFFRIRYYGIPAGHEISPITDAIVELSSSHANLSQTSKGIMATVRRKANIKIFVLTTCVYCPIVARHAYRAAIESPRVTTEIIDSQLFPDLAIRHSVIGVPKIILNDNTDITGAIQEAEFFGKLKDSDISLIDSMYG